MIKIIISCALILATGATYSYDSALQNTGTSTSSSERDAYGNYAFSYEIVDKHGASNTRSEVGDSHGNKKGSYSLHDVDGRARLVNYIADEHGFRVAISTNEPGTAKSAPAHAIIDSPYPAPEAPTAQVAPVTVVHQEPVAVAPISGTTVVERPYKISRVAPPVQGAFSTKSVVNHGVKGAHIVPVAVHTKSYVPPLAPVGMSGIIPAAYAKSVVSRPVAFANAIPLPHSAKAGVTHAGPFSNHFTTVPLVASRHSQHLGGPGRSFFQHNLGSHPFHSRIYHDLDFPAYNDNGLHKYFFNDGHFSYNN